MNTAVDSEVTGQQYGVLGAGASGRAAARLLNRHHARVLLSDSADTPELRQSLEPLTAEGIDIETGGHTTDRLLACDAIIISPGMNPNLPVVRQLEAAGVPVISEIELASRFCTAPIIAITGTNGKTTTTSLVGELLKAGGKQTLVAGNIGQAFADVADQRPAPDLVALEVSSYQLERLDRFHAGVSILLNITPDHLSRYASFEDYGRTKMNITNRQTANDWFFYNADDPAIAPAEVTGQPRMMPMSLRNSPQPGVYVQDETVWWHVDEEPVALGTVHDISLTGPHNAWNVMAALAAARVYGVQGPALQECLAGFRTLPHRLERVAVHNNVTWINDSKATNVDATYAALLAFERPVILIAGGQDKGSDLSILNPLLQDVVTELILTGDAAPCLAEAWQGLGIPISRTPDLPGAIQTASQKATPGATVLFSPACASFDAYNNFEERGEHFCRLVQQYIAL
jgi:UDP-N-acetylmuramoylalanine--D-glutamate ligase